MREHRATSTQSPTFYADGSPTDETLLTIERWPVEDFAGLVAFLTDAWNDYGRVEKIDNSVRFVTGGWRNNEELLSALRRNEAVQATYFESAHPGGLEIFRAPL